MTRLHKFLAAAGVASRRQSEQLMLDGRVTVDGKEVRDLGFQIEPGRQEVRVDGETVHEQPKHYFAVHKPAGYVCTHRDPAGRPRAIDLVPIDGLALFTVGRLDESSVGLLLVTNDGQLAQRLAHPAFHVKRTYHVQVAGRPTAETLELLRRGMHFAEGRFRVLTADVVRTQGKSTWLELVLTEGRNREIRRLLARVGHKVLHLARVAFGPVKLGRLPSGEFRELTPAELSGLREAAARKGRGRRGSAGTKPRSKSAAVATAGRPGSDESVDFDDEDDDGPVDVHPALPTGRLPGTGGAERGGGADRPGESAERRASARPRTGGQRKRPRTAFGQDRSEQRQSRRGAARFAGNKPAKRGKSRHR